MYSYKGVGVALLILSISHKNEIIWSHRDQIISIIIGYLTRNDVYETLCPQPFACQEGFITQGSSEVLSF